MADYVVGGVLVLLFVLAARSYFGRKFRGNGCGCGCSTCPHATKCGKK
ncbi:MAG: FeoB-associated Cys-rich membrane protein [Phascolarctobacterium sp.]|nr:FeoB-associated Cys-rich membrane protein [Phascolarctobacterium sp.]